MDAHHFIQYNTTIRVFHNHSSNHRPRIVCDACELPGHPANKCFQRGFCFLPRDIQRRISAYNTKYGDTSINDTPHQDTQTQLLPAPEAKLTNDHSSNIQTSSLAPQATIIKL